jgi:[histone H3]-dimethyl-L-lysine9 demethylase
MNALPDSHRRTSISQLLNPLSNLTDQQPFPLPQNSSLSGAVGPQPDPQPGQPPYNQGATFNLRAASWDHVQEDNNPNKRKPENGTSPSRVYHPSSMNSTDGFGDHGTHPPRRVDEAGNYVDNRMWSPSHEIASMPYGTTVIAPMYSDERTGMCFDPHVSSMI